jgi:hypothetical protein
LENKQTLLPMVTRKDIERLKSLVVDSIFEKFDPGEQDLQITDAGNGARSYTTHSFIHIFGHCVRLAVELNIDVSNFRTKIVNYIPFAYSEDLRSVFSLISELLPEEIDNLLAVYGMKKSDLWRFMPRSFIDACERYNIKVAVPVLKRFVKEKEFYIDDRIRAIRVAEFLEANADFLKDIEKLSSSPNDKLHILSEEANKLLIENHQDEEAVDWRFNEVRIRAFPFEEIYGVSSISSQESELFNKEFAAPLMNLNSEKYADKFIALLEKSFIFSEKKEFRSYMEYLWDIVCKYFENLKYNGSYGPLRKLELFTLANSSLVGMNWFLYRLNDLKRSYLSFLGKPKTINDCINRHNVIKSQQYFPITGFSELFVMIKEVIDDDIKRWVEEEGAYSFIVGKKIRESARQEYEQLIQKTIKTQIENAFIKKGFIANVIREPQLLDEKRTDFLIYYGFVGPILLEVKLSTSSDLGPRKKLESQSSYKNLVRYMYGYRAHYGIFLVFDNKKRSPKSESWDVQIARIRDSYQKISGVTVLGIKCR